MGCLEKIDPEAKYKGVFYDKLLKRCFKPFHQVFFMTQRLSFHQDFILRQYAARIAS